MKPLKNPHIHISRYIVICVYIYRRNPTLAVERGGVRWQLQEVVQQVNDPALAVPKDYLQ